MRRRQERIIHCDALRHSALCPCRTARTFMKTTQLRTGAVHTLLEAHMRRKPVESYARTCTYVHVHSKIRKSRIRPAKLPNTNYFLR
eukprot:13173322-Ditylum_brightwellii.AAC.1